MRISFKNQDTQAEVLEEMQDELRNMFDDDISLTLVSVPNGMSSKTCLMIHGKKCKKAAVWLCNFIGKHANFEANESTTSNQISKYTYYVVTY